MFGLDSGESVEIKRKSHAQFVEDWKHSMISAYKSANENIEKAANYNKTNYDKKVHGNELKVEDKVLIRNMREKGGTGKLRSHWERQVFKIIKKKEDLPVYIIKNINNNKDTRTVHRNMLMECNDLPNNVFQESNKVKVKPKVKKKENITRKKEDGEIEVEDDEVDKIVVFLHEDVPDSSFGGGDGGNDGVPEDVAEDIDVDGGIEGGDPELADLEAASDEDGDSDADSQDDPDPQPVRKSVRFSRAPKVFSYDEIGGPPVLIDIRK